MNDQALTARFRALVGPSQHGAVCCSFEFAVDPPPAEFISNITIVPFAGERVVVLRLASGAVDVPGGTLEPSERYLDALRRELREEAGTELLSFTPFGCWRCTSSASAPYRPHIPHPSFCRLVGYGDIVIAGRPTNPPGGEEVALAELLTVAEAATCFRAIERPDLADLYRLASELRAADWESTRLFR